MTERPYSDLEPLIQAAVDRSIDHKLLPTIKQLEKAAKKLEDLRPFLLKILARQSLQIVWLSLLTVGLSVLYIIVFTYIS